MIRMSPRVPLLLLYVSRPLHPKHHQSDHMMKYLPITIAAMCVALASTQSVIDTGMNNCSLLCFNYAVQKDADCPIDDFDCICEAENLALIKPAFVECRQGCNDDVSSGVCYNFPRSWMLFVDVWNNRQDFRSALRVL